MGRGPGVWPPVHARRVEAHPPILAAGGGRLDAIDHLGRVRLPLHDSVRISRRGAIIRALVLTVCAGTAVLAVEVDLREADGAIDCPPTAGTSIGDALNGRTELHGTPMIHGEEAAVARAVQVAFFEHERNACLVLVEKPHVASCRVRAKRPARSDIFSRLGEV